MDLTLRWDGHPPEDVLEAYALKRLAPDLQAGVEEHLLVCEACQDRLAQIDVFIAAMNSAPQRPQRPAGKTGIPLWAVGAAAAVLIAAFLVFTNLDAPAVPAVVVLSAVRGSPLDIPTAPPNRPLDLTISSTQVDERPGFHIAIVTTSGTEIWEGALTRTNGTPIAHVGQRLPVGLYWVRLYSPENELLQEYGLRVD